MKLSVIIPAYNVERYLDRCLESCLRQDLDQTEYEILVVNDGSKDKTMEKALKWQECHGNIKVFSQENKGLSEARNRGVDESSGEYVMFIDSDDWIADNCLKRIYTRCQQDSPDILRFCQARVTDDIGIRGNSYEERVESGKEALRREINVSATFAAYRREFLTDKGLKFYPGIYHEDNEFTPRAYYKAERISSINDIVYFVRQTPGSITRSARPQKSHDLMLVAERLTDFAYAEVEAEYRKYFHKQAADCLNVCFRNMLLLNGTDKDSLRKIIFCRRKELTGHFLKSSSMMHRIEGLLLSLFPNRVLEIFRILDWIHKK